MRVKPDHEILEYQLITEDLEQRTNYFTWIGQATILLDIDGTTFLFDPIFSERASPFTFIGPKRNIPPVIDIDNLPKIDYVFISHNHYDHLDKNSVKTIKNIIKNYDGSIDSILLGCTELPIVIDENYFPDKKAISSIDEYIKYLL